MYLEKRRTEILYQPKAVFYSYNKHIENTIACLDVLCIMQDPGCFEKAEYLELFAFH